jgi:hypothetical protein
MRIHPLQHSDKVTMHHEIYGAETLGGHYCAVFLTSGAHSLRQGRDLLLLAVAPSFSRTLRKDGTTLNLVCYVIWLDRKFATQNRPKIYPAFFLTFVPMRNNFRTVPVGSRFIWSYNSVTASKNPAIATNRSRV